jgi:hypothetical protein
MLVGSHDAGVSFLEQASNAADAILGGGGVGGGVTAA